jgi:hypothetical protein
LVATVSAGCAGSGRVVAERGLAASAAVLVVSAVAASCAGPERVVAADWASVAEAGLAWVGSVEIGSAEV